jgi:uncharacterized membrane protein (UPF0127 family)
VRWHKKVVSALNTTRGTVLGDQVRLAESGLTVIVGLLGERGLQRGDGLLIVPSQGVHTFGMLFTIDVIVLDNDWRVLAIRPDMRPFRMTRLYWKAAAVLELPAGTALATSTRVGDQLEFTRNDAVRR